MGLTIRVMKLICVFIFGLVSMDMGTADQSALLKYLEDCFVQAIKDFFSKLPPPRKNDTKNFEEALQDIAVKGVKDYFDESAADIRNDLNQTSLEMLRVYYEEIASQKTKVFLDAELLQLLKKYHQNQDLVNFYERITLHTVTKFFDDESHWIVEAFCKNSEAKPLHV